MALSLNSEDTIVTRPLVTVASNNPSPSSGTAAGTSSLLHYFRKEYSRVFPKYKGAGVLLLWNLIVGGIYGGIVCGFIGLGLTSKTRTSFVHVLRNILGFFAGVALVRMLFYPISGLVADLCCGRFRIVVCSLVIILCGSLCLAVMGVIIGQQESIIIEGAVGVVMKVVISLGSVFFVAGFIGFQANGVQFGLDQLHDASNDQLSVFLHWYVWSEVLGETVVRLVGSMIPCEAENYLVATIGPILLFVAVFLLMFLSCCCCKWFHSEPRTHNPYGTIYQVLKFVAKHDRPIRRSALTYCDDERPTRMEFAKEKYGGPFRTETVEDVKTVLRILLVLFFIGPVFNIQFSATYIFPIYGIHIGKHRVKTTGCRTEWLLLQSGNLAYVVSSVAVPLYVLFVHRHIHKYAPRILSRLLWGLALLVFSIASMFIIIMAANYHHYAQNNSTKVPCMFLAEIRGTNSAFSPILHFNTLWLVLPNILNGISIPLIYVTILEFISAQSPHTMKGLLLGVFYAFRGFFIMIGCAIVFPFAQSKWWNEMGQMFGCGFYYYLTNTALGIVGIIAVYTVVKCYHYREREDKPYDPSYVEDYYSRYTVAASPEETERSLINNYRTIN